MTYSKVALGDWQQARQISGTGQPAPSPKRTLPNAPAAGPENPVADRADALTYHGQLMGISEPPYYTGAQTQILIGTTFFLNAIDCTWNQNYDHLPYFGYRSEEYDYVFGGKTLTHGTLIINLLDNKLLELAMDRDFKVGGEQSDAQKIGEGLASGNPAAINLMDRLLIDRAKTGKDGVSFLNEIQRASTQKPKSEPASAVPVPPNRLAIRTLRWLKSKERFGIDIRCNIGDPLELGKSWAERRASVYEVLKGVIFTGENRSLRVSAEVIVQAYSFFAKRVDRSPE